VFIHSDPTGATNLSEKTHRSIVGIFSGYKEYWSMRNHGMKDIEDGMKDIEVVLLPQSYRRDIFKDFLVDVL
jgi:hypothetical protein